MSSEFRCEIQTRVRDLNGQGHVDNVEALRIVDEARALLLRFGGDVPGAGRGPWLLRCAPEEIDEVAAAHRIEYRTEMRVAPAATFLVRSWISRCRRSSFDVAAELSLADAGPTMVVATTMVLWNRSTDESWPMTPEVRQALQDYLGPPLRFRS